MGLLSGANTTLGAMIGGETEQRKWFTNTMVALTAPLYPNQAAQVSRAFFEENKLRNVKVENMTSGRTMAELKNTFKDRMFMGKQLPARVSIWGDYVPIIPDGYTPAYMLFRVGKEEKYASNEWGTRFYEYYEEYKKINPEEARKLLPSLPSGVTKVGWDNEKMDSKQLEEFQMKVGYWRRVAAERYIEGTEWQDATWEERTDKLTLEYNNAKKDVEAELFLWDDWKNGVSPQSGEKNKDNWNILYKNDALPMPTMIKKLDKRHKLDQEGVKEYNEKALDFYAIEVAPMLRDMPPEELAAFKQEPEEEDENGRMVKKESEFIKQLNRIWDMAKNQAKSSMIDELESKPAKEEK
jgi:hypothetical protein